MRMKGICYFVLSGILLVPPQLLYAQDQPDSAEHRLAVRDVYFITGAVSQSVHNVSATPFQVLAPSSKLLPLSSSLEGNEGLDISVNSLLDVSLGINFANKHRNYYTPNPQLRIGLALFSQTSLQASFSRQDRKPCDTVVNPQTNQVSYIDSVVDQHLHMEYGSRQLRLDVSLIYRTNRSRRFTLYAGAGITAGFALSAYTAFDYTVRRWTVERNVEGVYGDSIARTEQHEEFDAGQGWGAAIYFPLGVDFRVGRRREGLKRIHLFNELRPFAGTTSIPGLARQNSFGMYYTFGLRYALD
jgi:hypothetical protein